MYTALFTNHLEEKEITAIVVCKMCVSACMHTCRCLRSHFNGWGNINIWYDANRVTT